MPDVWQRDRCLFVTRAAGISEPLAWIQMTGKELEARGIINAAVPADQLDARVEAMVQALLRRTPYALALSKRALNRLYVETFNKLHDLSYSYELLNFYMWGRSKDGRGENRL